MILWSTWWDFVRQLRPAFARTRSFLWFAAALAAACIRPDLAGVTSYIRALGLREACYDSLLEMFHSPAVDMDALTRLWTKAVISALGAAVFTSGGRPVLLADGIKVPKAGRKMPAVKKLHQESDGNTKPEYIFGHSCQAVSLAIRAGAGFFALPLACRIHEGAVFSNRDSRTLLDRMVSLALSLGVDLPSVLVADAYYASKKVIAPLLRAGWHLVSSVRTNAVAYRPAQARPHGGPGRKRVYGEKVLLRTLFSDEPAFAEAPSPVYGETGVTVKYLAIDLVWRPVGIPVRFVLVIHPTRGNKILIATDLSMPAVEVIRLYGVRFKIEVSFKQAIHTVGMYAYHFWMRHMKPRPRKSGDQHLHRETKKYREAVRRKLRAYHCHIQLGVIAQGLLQTLAVLLTEEVWSRFGSWLRTCRGGVPPSERVTSVALRNALPEFLGVSLKTNILVNFIRKRLDLSRAEGLRLAS
jgi:hypothetical protein